MKDVRKNLDLGVFQGTIPKFHEGTKEDRENPQTRKAVNPIDIRARDLLTPYIEDCYVSSISNNF
jgi:hypothetical protein